MTKEPMKTKIIQRSFQVDTGYYMAAANALYSATGFKDAYRLFCWRKEVG